MTSDSATLTVPSAAARSDGDDANNKESNNKESNNNNESNNKESNNKESNNKEAQATVLRLLGSHVVCTLRDGRKARGTLVCVDRL
jgi:hypothetical protein